MTSRKYCLITSLWIILGLSFVACLNAFVDPYGQYGTGLLPVTVQLSRSQKVDLMESLDAAPDGLILGSSRVLKFEPNYLQEKTGLTFFNAGVNHGRPTDFIAIIRWYHDRWKHYPKMVFLGIDSAAFHKIVPLDARITNEPRLASKVPESVSLNDIFVPFTELIGFKQLRTSISSLLSMANPKKAIEPVEYYTRDGMIVYQHREDQLLKKTYDFDAALKFNESEYERTYQSFDELSSIEAVQLVQTIRLLREHGTQVHLFLTPFHPQLFDKLSGQPNFQLRRTEVWQLLNLFAEHWGAIVADMENISHFEGDANQFVDGIHPLEWNTRRMIDRMLMQQRSIQHAL